MKALENFAKVEIGPNRRIKFQGENPLFKCLYVMKGVGVFHKKADKQQKLPIFRPTSHHHMMNPY
jgi:hypothetical protein